MRYTTRHLRTRLMLLPLESRVTPAVFTVLNADDAGAGSLRQAIADANTAVGSDSIDFSPSFFNVPRTISLTSDKLLITDAVAITGTGANLLTISRDAAAATQFRVFEINVPSAQAAVTLTNMTISGGNTTGTPGGGAPTGDGAGLLMFNDIVTLDRVVMSGNTSGTEGGGIAVASINSGGAGSLFIRNSTVSGNSATAGGGFVGGGGGIYFANGGNLLLENSTVTGNSSQTRGGGMYLYAGNGLGTFTVRNSTIANNNAIFGGGIAFVQGGTLNNSLTVQNSTVTGNTATSGGGGIYRYNAGVGVVTLTSSVIAFNNDPISPDLSGPVTASFSLIRDQAGATITDGGNNLAAGTDPLFDGGATPALANNGGPTQTIAIASNSPLRNAGSNPTSLPTDQRGPGFPREVLQTDIGAFEFLPAGTPTANGTFPDLTAVAATYTFTVTYTDDTGIDVSTLGNNDVRVTGPNGYDQVASFVSVDNNTNGTPRTATYSITGPGGGSFTAGSTGTYIVSMLANSVTDTSGNPVLAGPLGQIRVIIGGTITVTNANDSGAGSLRAALDIVNTFPTTGDAIAFDPAFFNVARTISLTSGELLVADAVNITGPGAGLLTVQRDAGAATQFRIFNINAPGVATVNVSGMTVTGGNTTGTAGGGPVGDGAGFLVLNDILTLDGVAVTGNTSATEGGGIAVASINSAGGGSLVIRNSTISGNTANGDPGTGFGGSGGGIYFANQGSLVIENSTVSGNTSSLSKGGGIYFYGTILTGGFTISNSTIANNTATNDGGGLYIGTITGDALIRNSTIAGNTVIGAGEGGGIGAFSLTTGTLTLTSTVVAFNTAATGPDVFGPVIAGTSLIRNQADATITDNGGNLAANTDPLFVGGATPTLANNGGPTQTIALQAGSPLLNVGSNPANLTNDQRGPGFARTSGVGTDIGAFEVQAATAPTVVTNGVRVNGGQPNTTQRSRVTSIDIEFSTVVTFAGPVANAFQLSRIGGAAVGGFTAVANTVNGHTVVTLSGFTGAESQFGSLADGRYQLTALAAQITAGGLQLDGDGNGTGGDNFVLAGTTGNGLFRFYGDVTGDGTNNAADFGPFRSAFGTSTGNPLYRDFLDFNADNTINAADFAQFRSRFGASVP